MLAGIQIRVNVELSVFIIVYVDEIVGLKNGIMHKTAGSFICCLVSEAQTPCYLDYAQRFCRRK